jgi:hypothetical protein
MRALIALVLLVGCVGVGASGGARPAVMPMLSELPGDAAKRNAVLDSANTVAGPEQRPGATIKEVQAETAAATAAAILGSLFSKTQNTTLGVAAPIGDAPRTAPLRGLSPVSDPDEPAKPNAAPPADADPPNTDLIPWIKLK